MASSLEWKLELKDLPLLRRLGKGLSGYLNETVWRGKKYARKDFPLGSAERGSLLETEVQPLFNLDHPNIVKCFGYAIGKSSCSLLQEYVDYNLQNYIQRIIEERRRKASTGSSKPRVVDVDEIKGMLSANRVKRKECSGTYEGSSTVPEARSEVTESSSVNLGRQRSVSFRVLDDEDEGSGSAEAVNARLASKVTAKVLAKAAAKAFPEGVLEWTRRESSGTNETSSVFQKASSKMPESSLRMLARPSAVPCEVLDAEDIVTQIAKAMKYLHDNEVIHGDLKPKNVLWDLDESGDTKVKVADFGLIGTKKMIKLVSKRTRHFEILTWKAPELLEESLGPLTEDSDDPFTDSDSDLEEFESSDTFLGSKLAMADVYSFGLTCSYVLGAKVMYPNLSLTQLRQQRAQGFEPKLPSTCPEYLKFIIHSCLRMEPLSRPTFSAICTARAFLPNLPYLMKMLEGKRLEDFMALTTLKVNFEYNIGQLPSEIGNLMALETLELDRCYNLENLPSGIGNLMALKTLVMRYCTNLHTLPNVIRNLIALETLELDHCSSLEELPSGMGNLMALKTLVMRYCARLHTLPNEIGNLIALEALELDHCYKLEELPCGIGNLMALKTLVMRYCTRLHTLPNEIGNLIALETLELDHCYKLEELPSGIGNLMAIKTLVMRYGRNLHTLPDEIGDLIALETLELDHCSSLEELPSGIGNLMALKNMVIRNCLSLYTLPDEIENLIALETLELDHCSSLEELPSGIGNLMALKTLVMRYCTRLHTLPDEIGNLIALETLELNHCSCLEELPSGIGNLMALKNMVIRNCLSLYTLPDEIENLIALETLELDHCSSLEELPSGIGNLMALKTLVMRYCTRLHTLPNEIGNLIALETLELDHCYKLEGLPSGIGNLMALKTLVMRYGRNLYTLPDEIGNLIALETLELNHCSSLEELPSGIGNLMALKNMVIRNCSSLYTLPDEIENLTALKTLMVMDCPRLTHSRLTHSSTLEGLDVGHSSALRRLTPSDVDQDRKQKRQWHLDDSNEAAFLETWTREAALDTLTNWGTGTSTEKGEMDYLPIENRGGQSSQVASLQDELPMMQAQRLLDPQAHLRQTHHQQQHQHHQEGIGAQGFGQLPDELMRQLADQSQMSATGLLPLPPYSRPVKPEERSYDLHSIPQKQQHYQHQDYYDLGMPFISLQDPLSEDDLLDSPHNL